MKNPLTLIIPAALVAASLAQAQPNVIVLMTDDQGYGDLSCHGNPIVRTPHLDALHDESVRFTDFHVAPMCT
ncbi:MAG: sulfatase-like hydrolase/transferase, partial [Verrucomicrobiales bacterium]|nr:sulfatase-like hydrolase/transferase [Verrucomicrobiales bacterium]